MKKIISALVLGAAAVGFATADLKLQANYRNGPELFRYWNTRESGEKASKTLFNLNSWQSGNDNVTLSASGNIFSYKTVLVPKVASDDIQFKTMTIGAKVGNFRFTTGWSNDGTVVGAYRAHGDARNTEGKQFEAYKPGSTLGGFSEYSINETTFNKTAYNYFAQAAYKFGFGDRLSLDARVAAISNYAFSSADRPAFDASPRAVNDYLGWSVVLEPQLKDVFAVEALAKGVRQDKNHYGFVLGGYARLLSLPVLPQSTLGGAVGMYGGKVEEWSADLRLHFALGDRVHLTTMNNFTKVLRRAGVKKPENASGVTGLGNLTTGTDSVDSEFKSSQMLWNMLSLSFKLNETLTIVGTVGQQTDFDSGVDDDGTQIFVNPYVQIFAASNASISVGVVGAVGGIGAHKNRNKNVDLLVTVPLLFRVTM